MQMDRHDNANSYFLFVNIPQYEYGYRLLGIETVQGNFEMELGVLSDCMRVQRVGNLVFHIHFKSNNDVEM